MGPIVCGMYVTFVLSPLLLPRLALIYYHRGRKTAHMIQVIKFPMEKREVLLETCYTIRFPPFPFNNGQLMGYNLYLRRQIKYWKLKFSFCSKSWGFFLILKKVKFCLVVFWAKIGKKRNWQYVLMSVKWLR